MTAAELHGHVEQGGLPFEYSPLPKPDQRTGIPAHVEPEQLLNVIRAAFWVVHRGELPTDADLAEVTSRLQKRHHVDDSTFLGVAA